MSFASRYSKDGSSLNSVAVLRDGLLAVVVLLLLMSFWPLRTVPTGSRGVITVGGAIRSLQNEGFTLIAPWQKMEVFSIRAEQADIENAEGSTSDTQPVKVSLTVRYSIAPDRVTEVYEKYSHDGNLSNYVQTATQEVFKAVTARYSAPDLISQRAAVSADITSALRAKLATYGAHPQFAPENTLPSFQLALGAGADLVELDYYHSRDGKLVVIHDQELDRTTDATNRWHQKKILVESKTAAELQSLDAGSWFEPKYAGTRIPLLAEALDTIQKGSVTLIERKGGAPADCIRLLRDKNLINKVVVQSFDWEYLRSFHEQEPQQVLGALGPPGRLADGTPSPGKPKEFSAAWLDELQKTGAKVVVWSDKVSRDTVQLAHQRGLRVWVYTIDDPVQAQNLLAMGVDGIITNNTSLIRKAIALRGQRAP